MASEAPDKSTPAARMAGAASSSRRAAVSTLSWRGWGGREAGWMV